MEEDTIEIIDFLRVIWKQRLVILLVTLVAIIIAWTMTFWKPEVYETRATVLIMPPIYKSEISDF